MEPDLQAVGSLTFILRMIGSHVEPLSGQPICVWPEPGEMGEDRTQASPGLTQLLAKDWQEEPGASQG
jgi:hypothetical protein